MQTKRSYSISIYTLLIALGLLQLVWPWSFWILAYRLLAICGLLFVLLGIYLQKLISEDGRFNKYNRVRGYLKISISVRSGVVLLLAWQMNDPWSWWLSVSLIVSGLFYQWIIARMSLVTR